MLAMLTHEDFSQLFNKLFTAKINGLNVDFELIETKVLRESQSQDERDQFSLLFRGVADTLLPQQIYHLEHLHMGKIDLFLVPIGRENQQQSGKEGAYLYEAIFT